MVVAHLPNEILDMICQELSDRGDQDSLYSCAVASRRFATLALGLLYRNHFQSPVNDEEADGFSVSQQTLLVHKWAIMWRSVVLSTFGETIFPYCRYLRALDLRDLRFLLEDDRFARGKSEIQFFAGSMQHFHKQIEYTFTRGGKRQKRMRLDIQPIVESLADAVISHNDGLQEVSGEFSSDAFQRWQHKLPELQQLFLWSGDILGSQVVRDGIRDNCPRFNALSMHHWHDERYDQHLGAFLLNLPEQSLRSLETISGKGIGPETCVALRRHNGSLKDLAAVFEPGTVEGLSHLKECRALEKLSLEIFASADLESTHKSVHNDMLEWFGSLTNLSAITLTEFKAAPSLLMPLLLNQDTHLLELHLDGRNALYNVRDHKEFHLALSNQHTLQTLDLKGEGEDCFRDDIDGLVASLGELYELRKLKLRGVADMFGDEPMGRLFASLRQLEEVYIGGFGLTDAVLLAIAELPHLRTITFAGLTGFTAEGLRSLIEALRPSQEGFFIAVDVANPDTLIDESEINTIRQALFDKVGGRLDYIPLRDPDVPEFEGESD